MTTNNQQPMNESFLTLSPKKARSLITRDIQANVMGKNPYLRTLAIQNKLGFRETYYRARSGQIIDLFALVSPTYTNNQELSNDSDYFTRQSSGLESRVPAKLNASIEAIKLIGKYFTFRINIVIADTGLLLSDVYTSSNNVGEAIGKSELLYRNRVAELLPNTLISTTRLSSLLGRTESKVVKMGLTPTRKDCEEIIKNNSISPEKLLSNLGILISAFGLTVAYYELQAYFEESRLLGDALGRDIILNIEGTSVGNKLLTKGRDNLCVDRGNLETNRGSRKGGNLLIGGTVTL